jgi:hypothetical protein
MHTLPTRGCSCLHGVMRLLGPHLTQPAAYKKLAMQWHPVSAAGAAVAACTCSAARECAPSFGLGLWLAQQQPAAVCGSHARPVPHKHTLCSCTAHARTRNRTKTRTTEQQPRPSSKTWQRRTRCVRGCGCGWVLDDAGQHREWRGACSVKKLHTAGAWYTQHCCCSLIKPASATRPGAVGLGEAAGL